MSAVSERNSHPLEKLPSRACFVDKLPPELMESIFESATALAGYDSYFFSTDTSVVCSQVCQFWRNITLSRPSLWNCIEIGHGAADELIRRSSPLPIRLTVRGQYPKFTLDKLCQGWPLNYAACIEGIMVETPDETMLRLLKSKLGPNLSNLSVLHLSCTSTRIETFFGRINTSALYELTLIGVVMDTSWCRGLTHLELESLNSVIMDCPSAAQIIDLLIGSPALRTLLLRDITMEADLDEVDNSLAILPRLERWELSDLSLSMTQYMLKHIAITPSAPIVFDAGFGKFSSREICERISNGVSKDYECVVAFRDGLWRFTVEGNDNSTVSGHVTSVSH